MKMSKRIFMVLLIFAVVISSMTLFAFADEAETETAQIKDFSYILEYYEEQVIFGYDLNGEGDFDYSDALLMSHKDRVNHSIVTDVDAPGGKYIAVEIVDADPYGEENVFLNWNGTEGLDNFYFDTTLAASCIQGVYLNYPKYRLIVSDENFENISNSLAEGTSILTLDFQFGLLSYASGVDADGKIVETIVDYQLSVDTWYNVSVDYAADGASIVITNAQDSSDTVTVSDVYVPYEVVKNVRFGVHGSDATSGVSSGYHDSNGNIMKIASISAASGTVRRNTANRQKGLEDAILEIYDVYSSEDIAIQDKTALCEVVNKLVSYGFTTDDPAVAAAVTNIKAGSVKLYADALERGLADIATTENYYDKKQKIDKTLEYAVVLEGMDLSSVGEEEAKVITDNIAAIYDADVAIEKAEADSLSYIEILTDAAADINSTDYTVLLGYYDAVSVLSPDYTYEGVADVHEYYLAIVDAMKDIADDADIFIAEVERLGDTSRDFMLRYADYLSLKENIYTNVTYPGVAEALALYNDVVLPDILYNISLAENFVMYVERANFATYVSAKEENLKIAAEYMEVCHPDFKGVAEAKELRLTILAYIEEQKANARAYIEAVNALDSLTGDALTAAIARAELLQKTGNVLGVEGVTEANIKLNQISYDIKLKVKYSEYFVDIVASLEFLYKAEELYDNIVKALDIQPNVDMSYPGVADAAYELEWAIENYNTLVTNANVEFETANIAVANTFGIGKTSNTVADQVIAIVQGFFYEEEDDEEASE